MKKAPSSPAGGQVARFLAVLGVNIALALVAVILGSRPGGELPELNARTLAVGLLPVSAALGLVVACRRIDFALPMILVLAATLRGQSFGLSDDPFWCLVVLCGITAGVGLVSALVTWYGRISSALWTALLAFGLWLLMAELKPAGGAAVGEWPWTASLGASVGLLVVAAAVLGAIGLVNLPSSPPISRTGASGLAGLALAWMFACAAMALASQSGVARKAVADYPLAGYPVILSAAAMGGAYILRGRWGAPLAIILTGLGHLTWSFAWSAGLGNPLLDVAIPAAAPLAAIILYLLLDWTIRGRTGESAPTGLLA